MSGNGRGWPYEPVDGRSVPPPGAPPVEADPPPVEVAEGPAGSRRAVVLLAVGGALALIVSSLAIGDWWVRNAELRTLLGRVERAERAQLPAVLGIGPLLALCQQEGAEALCDTVSIRLGAERTLPQLRQTGDLVAATRLTSFHGSLRTFRDRYVDHNLAWRDWLETLASDPTAGAFEVPDAVGTTFRRASTAADGALTPLALHGNPGRIDEIFESARR